MWVSDGVRWAGSCVKRKGCSGWWGRHATRPWLCSGHVLKQGCSHALRACQENPHWFAWLRDPHNAVPVSQPLPRAEGTVPYEPYGEGANAYVYFVSNTLGGQLSMLPYVTPEQVKASRLLRRFLTGRLDAPVSSFPAFPGTESHYLRALIARISAATVCCPKGYFLADEVRSRGKGREE